MKEELEALWEGDLSFARFAELTRDHWRRMSQFLFDRWVIPAGVTREDIEQEMLLEAWEAVEEYDILSGSMNLHRYVTWRAFAKGKRYIHSQRNARRRDGKGSGRFPHAVAQLSEQQVEEVFSSHQVEPNQHTRLEYQDRFHELMRTAPNTSKAAILCALVLNRGVVDDAVKTLWTERKLRVACGLKSERSARKAVRKVAKELTERGEW